MRFSTNVSRALGATLLGAALLLGSSPETANRQTSTPGEEAYLAWRADQANRVIKTMVAKCRVPGRRRVLNTEAAQKYDVRAIWMTPEVIRASARLIQIDERLTVEATRLMVEEAEAVGALVILVEIDPDEGSGVVPNDWGAFLHAFGKASAMAVRGAEMPRLQNLRVFDKVVPRDYKYDRFWMVFPTETGAGQPVISDADREVELTVRIRSREASVRWSIPESIRQRFHTGTVR